MKLFIILCFLISFAYGVVIPKQLDKNIKLQLVYPKKFIKVTGLDSLIYKTYPKSYKKIISNLQTTLPVNKTKNLYCITGAKTHDFTYNESLIIFYESNKLVVVLICNGKIFYLGKKDETILNYVSNWLIERGYKNNQIIYGEPK